MASANGSFIERLSGERRCAAADMMAYGLTEVADGQDVSVAAQASMLATLLDKPGIAAVDLIANDSGGAVIQIFIARYPGRVRSALLTNCDTEPDSPPPGITLAALVALTAIPLIACVFSMIIIALRVLCQKVKIRRFGCLSN